MKMFAAVIACCVSIVGLGAESSPYAGQEERAIKALSSDEVENYLAGKGAGFAKAAELNHYPGPRHVLDLARELELTAEQRKRSQEIFDAMQSRAIALGTQLVGKERELDRRFASGAIDPSSLDQLLSDIGKLQAGLRYVHLSAHLEEKRLLSAEQARRYDQLRGYDRPGTQTEHMHQH